MIATFVIGGGHFYSGEPGKGLLLWGTGATGGVIALTGYKECWSAGDCARDSRVMLTGASIMWAAYLTSLIDAHNAAHRHNRSVGLEPPVRRVGAVIAPGAGETTRVGVSIALGR